MSGLGISSVLSLTCGALTSSSAGFVILVRSCKNYSLANDEIIYYEIAVRAFKDYSNCYLLKCSCSIGRSFLIVSSVSIFAVEKNTYLYSAGRPQNWN